MRVAVCCKGVPAEAKLESVSVGNGDIQYTDTELFINEFDAYALETAVTLKDSHGAETVALTIGPLRAQEVLHVALAKGIDKVFRIDGETSHPEQIALGLVPALREIAPQIVLVGVQSEDWMGGEVGVYLSYALNMSLAYAVVEVCEIDDTHIRVQKEIGGGRKAEMRLKLPAVLCVQSGIVPIRYLSISKLKKARNNPIKFWGTLDPEARKTLSGMTAYEITGVSLPMKEGHAEMIEGDRPERARKILDLIKKAV